jgi:hypothetical protein
MKLAKLFLSVALVMTVSATVNAFPLLADWGFEVNTPPDSTDAAANGPHSPDGGSGAASGLHAGALTDWTTPAGNGSANSYSTNTWAVGDYYQFCTSTLGESNISLDWDHTSSNTGPRDFIIQWSNGGGFTTFGGNHAVLANGTPNPAWNATTSDAGYHFSENLSSVTALNNQAQICLRLVDNSTVSANGGVVAAGGTSRVDNVRINTPEPATLSLLMVGGLALIRRRR